MSSIDLRGFAAGKNYVRTAAFSPLGSLRKVCFVDLLRMEQYSSASTEIPSPSDSNYEGDKSFRMPDMGWILG